MSDCAPHGLIADESTNVTFQKELNLHVNCLSENKVVIYFMYCIKVPAGKAETIGSEL